MQKLPGAIYSTSQPHSSRMLAKEEEEDFDELRTKMVYMVTKYSN